MNKQWFWWIIACLLLVTLFYQIDLDELYQSLSLIQWQIIGVLVLLQILSQLLLNYQWYRIAKFTAKDISFWQMFYINSQGSVMESITPGVKVGGEITRAFQIGRVAKCPTNQGAVIVALQKIFSLSAFMLINIFSAMYLFNKNAFFQGKLTQLTIYTVFGAFLIFFILIFCFPQRILQRLSKQENSFYSFIKNLLEYVLLFEKQKTELLTQFLLALLIWLLYPIKLYLLAIQIQPGLPLVYIASITFISYMIGMIPLFPGGLGGFEGTMTSLLTGLGLSFSGAVALALIFRFITFWLVIIGSLGFIVFYKMIEKVLEKERMLPDE